jgi:hypothetical protein
MNSKEGLYKANTKEGELLVIGSQIGYKFYTIRGV